MIRFQAGRLAVLLGPMVLLAACGGSGVQQATRDLEDRLHARLDPDIAAGHVALQPLPAGARVTLPDATGFASGGAELSDKGRDVLASTIQGLLAPSLMRIDVSDAVVTLDGGRSTRVGAVRQYFLAYGLGPSLLPAGQSPAMRPAAAGPSATGLAITINVQCPSHQPPAGDDSAPPQASCN